MKKHVLEVDGIQKSFKERLVLSNIYLKCETTEIIGLLGRNGSGKSTLFKIIFGIESALNKSIRIDGVSKNLAVDVYKDISYLHQEKFIPNHLSVRKTISLSVEKEKINTFCDDRHILALLNKKIKHLSGGELRYLQIKTVLFNPTKFVLLDEPYSGLSPLMIDLVNALIVENSKFKGIIITDHNYENVIRISTRLILLKDGKSYNIKEKAELVW
ncbi:MAG: ATP-binding cassette domain-containing protein [Flavobacterium sp.]